MLCFVMCFRHFSPFFEVCQSGFIRVIIGTRWFRGLYRSGVVFFSLLLRVMESYEKGGGNIFYAIKQGTIFEVFRSEG